MPLQLVNSVPTSQEDLKNKVTSHVSSAFFRPFLTAAFIVLHVHIFNLNIRYYYKRPAPQSTTAALSTNTASPSTSSSVTGPPAPLSPSSSCSLSPRGPSEERAVSLDASGTTWRGGEASGLADFMKGVSVFFYNIGATERKKLARYLITYPLNSL